MLRNTSYLFLTSVTFRPTSANIHFSNLGVAALTFAASKGHLEIVRLLIQHGALVNAVDHSDSSALVAAAKNGHLDVVGHLVSNCEWSTDSVHDLGSYIFDIIHREFFIIMLIFYV